MKKAIFAMMFLSVMILGYSQLGAKAKLTTYRSVKANQCVDVYMTRKVNDTGRIEFFVYAKNKCNEVATIKKNIKVTAAKNVTAKKGDIVDLSRFIVPKREIKMILTVEQDRPGQKKTVFWWKLTRSR